jgi:hypothetical protein
VRAELSFEGLGEFECTSLESWSKAFELFIDTASEECRVKGMRLGHKADIDMHRSKQQLHQHLFDVELHFHALLDEVTVQQDIEGRLEVEVHCVEIEDALVVLPSLYTHFMLWALC